MFVSKRLNMQCNSSLNHFKYCIVWVVFIIYNQKHYYKPLSKLKFDESKMIVQKMTAQVCFCARFHGGQETEGKRCEEIPRYKPLKKYYSCLFEQKYEKEYVIWVNLSLRIKTWVFGKNLVSGLHLSFCLVFFTLQRFYHHLGASQTSKKLLFHH